LISAELAAPMIVKFHTLFNTTTLFDFTGISYTDQCLIIPPGFTPPPCLISQQSASPTIVECYDLFEIHHLV
jgi:hypothetical protein